MTSRSLLWLLLAGCAEAAAPLVPPDPARVFEVRQRAERYLDLPFDAEVVTQFRTAEVLPGLDVQALALTDGTVYAGTTTGLYRLDPGGERFLAVGTATGAVFDLAVLEGGGLLLATGTEVRRLDASGAERSRWRFARPVAAVAAANPGGGEVYAAGARGLLLAGASGTSSIAAAAELEVHDLLWTAEGLWIAAANGVYRYTPQGGLRPLSGGPWSAAEPARALALGTGELWIASPTALTRAPLDGRAPQVIRPGRGGLPSDGLQAVAAGGDTVLVGHAIGASALSGAEVEHYHSLRWLPAEEVRAVAVGADRSRWMATPLGVSRVAYAPITLAEKAERMEALIEPTHIRMDGFVDDDVGFDSPYDHSAGAHHWDNDNDGLWTEMQLGTWCFAYAVTGEQRYLDRARRSLKVMLLQIDVPGDSFAAQGRARGFITRSLVRDDEQPNFDSKAAQSNWHRQEHGGRSYYWKGGTSSDEYAGHYFGLPVYFDLCAQDEAEREQIRRRLRLSTDYVMQGGYKLIDLDGQPTSDGRWDNLSVAVDGLDGCPGRYDLVTCINAWGGGGWLNSLEVLGMLLATWHITGEQRYYDAYEQLYSSEKYGRLIPITPDTLTVTSPRFANHSDHELAMLAYFTLLRYEPNEDRRALIVRSFLDFYEYEREEHNPWQVATLALAHEPGVDLAGAVKSLRDIPLDRRNWYIDNHHRLDAATWPVDRSGLPQFDRVFPYDEINALKWNSDPYNVADGFMGYDVISPTPYLIAYWMARYDGLVQ